ncbi:uncharacterized protein PHACADRAFT_250242 [Phanerochaete carnosa HHB-10118-sp]|uniref:Scd2/ral3 n=1 Tax=Phanerochaete carnosa (strain HHB-10118-sp) TaxID=650164 RepID=K5WKE1_PHACS|nr:uncharacterized protein PHACADRAFT_250242 [Phanerochaete carnosa HHB-10118-sp]EKM59624.1 hypothetical protein PHACADRAFT_250242 [Phanerochaete carnosa HHB-10118-sp]
MKSLRKSLSSNGHKEQHISSPLPSSLSKPLTAIQPPKKVIRALQTHKASAPQELSFEKGDFFHVANEVSGGEWYEAHNPATGARGLVPVAMFEEFQKGAPTPKTPAISSANRPNSPTSSKSQTFYAVVLHDFAAERADELEAKAGDAITVVAQSNREWFVAKPIGKLGRPGLIPVSFVEIRDPTTRQAVQDINSLIDGGALPPVEEWKRQIMAYKANSISLGVLDDAAPLTSSFASAGKRLASGKEPSFDVQGPTPVQHHSYHQHSPILAHSSHQELLPEGVLISAEVKSFHYETDEYWFRVHALYQPYGQDTLPPAKQLVLFRSYNDFYDFQVQLLDAFPPEAGRDGSDRILPYMPGPVPHVDAEITATRLQELDEYLRLLATLRFSARHILEHRLIREFLALKPGDASQDSVPQYDEIEALPPPSERLDAHHSHYGVEERFSRMRMSNGPDSGYEENDTLGRSYDGGNLEYISKKYPATRDRAGSNASISNKHPLNSTSMIHSRSSSRIDLPDTRRSHSSLEIDPYRANSHSRTSLASSQNPSPVRSSHTPSIAASASSRSRANTPSISASVPQAAFVKIKIYDKDETVAIRVHPRVTYAQLSDKVQARLGRSPSLRYRDDMNNDFYIETDEDLRLWMDSSERHVLWAE